MIAADMLLQQKQIYNFLRTLTIKFDPIAQYINDNLISNGISVNEQDPTTWKYYLNLTGQYHSSDTLMYVLSLDNKQNILFTNENLINNPRTREAYLPGGQYYTRLCQTYPSQVDLIKSILFPVNDINSAINADDFTILNYGEGYLESWEEPMILSKLEEFLSIYVERWYFDFLDDEPYFYLTAWGSLWYYLASVIMTARIEFIRTPYVHSWHIWQELQANGISDYSDILSRSQSMMLYQNIDYLKYNTGKQSNLIILADTLLAGFGIGLYGRRIVQESESGASAYQLNPQLEAVRIPTSYGSVSLEIPPAVVSDIQSEIYQLGLTPSDDTETVTTVQRHLGDTSLNDFMTKFLEIRPIAKNTPYALSMSNFFMETLVVSIVEGYYTTNITVVDPITNTILYMTPAELLVLYNYAINQSLGLNIDTIPTTFNLKQSFLTKIGTPNPSFYIGTMQYVVDNFIDVNEYYSGLSYNISIQNPGAFSTMTGALWLKYMEHLILDENTVLDKKRQILKYLSSFCHESRQITFDFVPGFTSYAEWFGPNGIDIRDSVLSQYPSQSSASLAWENLAITIISALVPTNDVITSYSDQTLSEDNYNRITKLFIDMCSYTVLFLQSSSSTPLIISGYKYNTDLGPVVTVTYKTYNFILEQHCVNTMFITSDLTLDSGVIASHKDNINQSVDYSLTPIQMKNISSGITSGYNDMNVSSMSSSAISQGNINFSYRRMNVTIPR